MTQNQTLSKHYDLGADLAIFANSEVPKARNNNNLEPKFSRNGYIISKIRLLY